MLASFFILFILQAIKAGDKAGDEATEMSLLHVATIMKKAHNMHIY